MSWGSKLFDQIFQLRAGGESAIPFNVWTPGIVNVTAAGTAGFYLGVYAQSDFERIRTANPSRFPFVIGAARTTHFLRARVSSGPYVAIVRVTSFAPREAEVRVVGELQV